MAWTQADAPCGANTADRRAYRPRLLRIRGRKCRRNEGIALRPRAEDETNSVRDAIQMPQIDRSAQLAILQPFD